MNYGDIFWADLPDQGGHEQSGYRPVIIFQDPAFQCPTTLIIPLTSQLDKLHLPGTVEIQPGATNGLKVRSVALVFQLRALDVKAIKKYIGTLDAADLAVIQATAKRLMMLP